MMRRILVLIALGLVLPIAALAGAKGGHHAAPAPLLAAGIPAFAALGGGSVVLRLLRIRRRPAPVAD